MSRALIKSVIVFISFCVVGVVTVFLTSALSPIAAAVVAGVAVATSLLLGWHQWRQFRNSRNSIQTLG